ncbi:Peptide chain release factor 1 [Candidatus Hodgkinia cicadicola]|nr:Peptide chain release factor 1 [Candidatus Hodgkinia cicadicola]
MAKPKARNLQNGVRVAVAPAQTAKIVVEFKPGVGDTEASLFALLRVCVKFAIKMSWSRDVMCANSAEGVGIKEASLLIAGKDATVWLAHKPGVHRVQTETKGQAHASAVTVAILTAVDNIDRIQLFCHRSLKQTLCTRTQPNRLLEWLICLRVLQCHIETEP